MGGIVWAAGVTVLGSLLGDVAFIRKNVDASFVLIVLVSVVPIRSRYLEAAARRRPWRRRADPKVTQRSRASI